MDVPDGTSSDLASRQMEDPQPSAPEPSPHPDLTNDTPTLPKMPGTLTLDDHEDDLSSSSGEISEPSSHDSMDTVRPQNEEETGQEVRQSTEPLIEEYENLPPPSDIHGLPRVCVIYTCNLN